MLAKFDLKLMKLMRMCCRLNKIQWIRIRVRQRVRERIHVHVYHCPGGFFCSDNDDDNVIVVGIRLMGSRDFNV